MNFTKINVRKFQDELLFEMQAVGDKHGFTVSIAGGSLTDSMCTLKFTLTAGTGEDADKVRAHRFGLDAIGVAIPAEYYGKTFNHGGTEYRVVRINRKARKTPVVCEEVNRPSRLVRFSTRYVKLLLEGKA